MACGCYYSVLQKTGSLWMLKGKDLLPLHCAVYRYMFCFSGRDWFNLVGSPPNCLRSVRVSILSTDCVENTKLPIKKKKPSSMTSFFLSLCFWVVLQIKQTNVEIQMPVWFFCCLAFISANEEMMSYHKRGVISVRTSHPLTRED